MCAQAAMKTNGNDTTNNNINMIDDTEGSRKLVKKNKHRSSSSLEGQSSMGCPFHHSSTLSFSAEFGDQSYDSLPSKSSLAPPSPSLKSQRNARGIHWQWSRIHKRIKTRKVIGLMGRRSTDTINRKAISKGKRGQDQYLSSSNEEDSGREVNPLSQDIITNFSFNPAKKCHLCTSLSNKYQPKFFHDIAGHEIVIKVLSNAVEKLKIVPLYLFHGASGTGKTSTARTFAMALNCESTTHTKPCWSCKGCSRSLYIMELCSGSRISGFEKIKTLLQSTTFTQIVTSFSVFIIEECHSLTAEAWEEILNIVERSDGSSTVVFVMITEDPNMVPRAISSRCQKFFFPKLKDMDITLKLTRIVAQEDIEIERDALKLIISKAEGSMREAENILDQMALLGSRITSSMVQQIVGLVPRNKLLDLLNTAISADTNKTARSTRELIASGVQPQSLVSQLASLITDILSSASAFATTSSAESSKGTKLAYNQSDRLSHALKILVETEKQPSSSIDHTTWVVATLLQIASEQLPDGISSSIVFPKDIIIHSDDKFDAQSIQNSMNMNRNVLQSHNGHHGKSKKYNRSSINVISEQSDINTNDPSMAIRSIYNNTKRCRRKKVEREVNLGQMGDMEKVWKNMLGRIECRHVKEFLCQQGKLASLTISTANAIVHLTFKRPEDKLAAQMSEETIAKALSNAFGCPVTVNMSLEPMQFEIIERNSFSSNKSKGSDSGHSRQQKGRQFIMPSSESPCRPNAGGVVVHSHKTLKSSSLSENNSRLMSLPEIIETSQGWDRGQEATIARPQQILPFSGPLTKGNKMDGSANAETNPSTREQQIPGDMSYTTKSKPKHRCLSLSSIQQGDASVERYSQDLLFENVNTDREKCGERRNSKLHKTFSKANEEDQHNQHRATTHIGLNRSWSCSEIFCRRETKVSHRKA